MPYQQHFLVHDLIRHLVIGIMFFTCTSSLASKPENVTPGEIALLPTYCIDTMGFGYGDAYTNTSPRAGKWVAMMGKSFWAMHHFCWALIDVRRAEFMSSRSPVKAGTLARAVGNYQYTINHSTPNFILLPEIYTKLGEAELLLSHIGAASEAFQRARELKPDYWPPYASWAAMLIRSGQKAEAKRHLKLGLENAPDAKILIDQYRALGGDPAEIAPIPKKVAIDAVVDEPASAASSPAPAK
jgi:tetratricopeptide (TPR) repeat protein